MTLRVDVAQLPAEVIAALERGDTVEFERHGEIVGRVEIEPKRISWPEYWRRRSEASPLDDDFLSDLEEIRNMLNAPMTNPWES